MFLDIQQRTEFYVLPLNLRHPAPRHNIYRPEKPMNLSIFAGYMRARQIHQTGRIEWNKDFLRMIENGIGITNLSSYQYHPDGFACTMELACHEKPLVFQKLTFGALSLHKYNFAPSCVSQTTRDG